MHIISSDSGSGSQVVVVVVVVVVEVEVEVEVVVVLSFNTNNIEGTLPALMHCAPRTYIPRISCYTKLQIVVKGFSKDSVSVRTTQAIRLRKIVIRSNGSGIRSNGLSYLFKTIISRATVPNTVGKQDAKCGHLQVNSAVFIRLSSKLQDGRNLYSKQSHVFCFSILTVFGGKMTSQD